MQGRDNIFLQNNSAIFPLDEVVILKMFAADLTGHRECFLAECQPPLLQQLNIVRDFRFDTGNAEEPAIGTIFLLKREAGSPKKQNMRGAAIYGLNMGNFIVKGP